MPEEWDNIVMKGKDDYLRMDYTKTTPLLWSALQYVLNENEEMKEMLKDMKKSITYLKGELTKIKNKSN